MIHADEIATRECEAHVADNQLGLTQKDANMLLSSYTLYTVGGS
jgi:hypothetical protein